MKRSIVTRLVAYAATAGIVAAVPFVSAAPALAANCTATTAVVYETSTGSSLVNTQNDPVNAGYYVIYVDVPSNGGSYNVRLGGNGLEPQEYPFWGVFSANSGQFIGNLFGNKTGNNCVSNEKSYPLFGSPGDVYLLKANYFFGTDPGKINDQEHVAVAFY